MNRSNIVVLIVLSLIFVIACKSKKSIHSANNKEQLNPTTINTKAILLSAISKSNNTFSYYSASGKVNYKDAENNQDLGIQITMEKNQYIYLNVTALLGIPVARVLATTDSLVILDLLHRKVVIANYSYVKKLTGVSMGLTQLQNLLLGNTLFENIEQTVFVDSTVNGILLQQPLTTTTLQKTAYSKELLKVITTIVYEKMRNQQFTIEYSNFIAQNENRFPAKIDINIKAEKNIVTDIELKNFVFEKKKDIQFTIPNSYERIRF